MSEPTPHNNPNLDEMTRLVLRIIDLEKTQEQLEKSFLVLEDILKRLSVLEESRQRQISLNSTFALKVTQPKELPKEPPKKWKFW